jgi:signal transduction histidine kinase/CheY-like chemotaxis protein
VKNFPILSTQIRHENDIVYTRQRARQVAEALSFDVHEQTRIATAVSEIARNAFMYAKGGKAEFSLEDDTAQHLRIVIKDQGPGIPELARVLDGNYVSRTGLGIGIAGTRRLMDRFAVTSDTGGTQVTLHKQLRRRRARLNAADITTIAALLSAKPAGGAFEELQIQNHELIQTLEALRTRESELHELNRELEDTNRGVVALYAELDEKAASLKEASESKAKFFANMTHEFRTPLNSIINISSLLLDRVDGELTLEQDRQVQFIRKSAESLSTLVNDLLDIAKVEAGKIAVRENEFTIEEVFGALRGMFRFQVLQKPDVNLVFDAAPDLPALHTDEGKLAQILRNLVSNALKYTSRGWVRVSARSLSPELVELTVDDTGIGIAGADHERVFEDFIQIENPLQAQTKGTGLGLPLSQRLARLLGGHIALRSEEGRGSRFTLTLPRQYVGPREASYVSPAPPEGRTPAARRARPLGPAEIPLILLVDDDEAARRHLSHLLSAWDCRVITAADGDEGLTRARTDHPHVIVLDYVMPGMNAPEVIERLQSDAFTADIPVILHTSKSLDDPELQRLAPATAAILQKQPLSTEAATAALGQALARTELAIVPITEGSPA